MSLTRLVQALLSFMQRTLLRAGLVIGAAALVIGLAAPHAKVKTDAIDWMTPNGILELELAGTRDGAIAIAVAWTAEKQVAAAVHAIYWDFLLIVGYTFGIYIAIRYLTASIRPAGPTLLDRFTAFAILFAGLCDCIENVGMLGVLSAPLDPAPGWLGTASSLTTLISLVKWTLLFLCIGHLIWLLMLCLRRWIWPAREAHAGVP